MVAHRVSISKDGWVRLMNGRAIARYTEEIAKEIVEEAIRVYRTQAKHKEEGPIFYAESFKIEAAGKSWKIYNFDPIANLVEFGAHPGGGETFTLRYRPLGRGVQVVRGRHI